MTQLVDCDPDNLDYNALKHLIKVNTTRDQATGIAIPGQADAALQKFEESFFLELHNQHDRVDLFVQDKTGEVHRRLSEEYPESRSQPNTYSS